MSADEQATIKSPRIPGAFWAVMGLVAWALAITALLNRSAFGLDEATARVILLLWSVSDQVAAPVVTMGVPDFRAAYLIPAGMLFSGSLLAAKILTLLLSIALGIGLYRWRLRSGDTESPLIATGLLLISPLLIAAVDHVAIGPFLLLTFLLGALAEDHYRLGRVRFGGGYFFQLILTLAAVTLHPAGLALPLALAVPWLRPRATESQEKSLIPGSERSHMLLGLALATLFGALLAGGWRGLSWFGNPVTTLARHVFALSPEAGAGDALAWGLGSLLLVLVVLVLVRARAQILDDRLGTTVALAVILGALSGDDCFAMLAFTLLLYWGFPLLLRVQISGKGGFVGQRGVAFALLLLLCTVFLSSDRARYEQVSAGLELSEQDQLIQALAATVQQAHPAPARPGLVTPEEKARSGPRVASQWPGRTMIACRCGTLPLPPSSEDQAAFLANLRGVDYVIFDPRLPANLGLSRNFSLLNGNDAQTIALQPGGVVLHLNLGAAQDAAPDSGAHG